MDDKNVKKLKIPGFVSKLGIVFVLIALVILWSCLSSAFFTVNNMLLIVKQVSMYSILCVGMTFVLITGGIDLSVGSIVALAAVFAAHYCSGDYLETPLIVPIAIAVFIGLGCGLINGICIAYGNIPPFIMTMCMMLAARGAAYVYTNAKAIFNLNPDFVNISNGFLGRTYTEEKLIENYGIPYMVFYFAAAVLIGIVILHFTTYGRRIYAIGGNKVAARYSGINTKLVECSVYVLSGLCSGICGFLMASRISSGNANSADGYEMTVISAAVIGGVSLSGGVGSMYGAMIGVLIVGVIRNGMDILGINTYFQQILQAVDGPGKAHIPHLIVPGCLDMVNFGTMDTVPEKYVIAERKFYNWNPMVTLMRTNEKENEILGKILAEKANESLSPVAFLFPLEGISILDGVNQPFCDWKTDKILFESIRKNVKEGIPIKSVEANLNDDLFAEAAVENLLELMNK